MEFNYDIFTLKVEFEHRNIKIEMLEYTTEDGEMVILREPVDVTYIVNDEVYNEAKQLISEQYEEYN